MTMGFENHTPEKVTLWTDDGDLNAFEFADELVVSISKAHSGSGGRYVTLNRREAIYLRNRLTAFIEKGIGDL
jgi:hypothetical protein